MSQLETIGRQAKETESFMRTLASQRKNEVLLFAADALIKSTDLILEENMIDVENGRRKGMHEGLIDRLMLTSERIEGMAEGLRSIAALEDPIGEVLGMKERPNGLLIGQKRVPLGVVGIIYEARPNVTADAFGLCFKTGNVVILKGGSDAIHSNKAIVTCLQTVLDRFSIPRYAIQLIEDTSREVTAQFMRMRTYVDVLIPRGGAGLIRSVVDNSTIPVIETGTGNCHIYVDESADYEMAANIIFNAKTQRIGVCNACESLVIHEKIVDAFMPELAAALQQKDVSIHADEKSLAAAERRETANGGELKKELLAAATEEDWGREYLDYMISVKTVSSLDEAIAHINRYNTGHSEAIITENYANAQRFLDEIDAACVYVNASTRFSDGFEFGFGAEIGISTQKLHARGPMGLDALTSTKYIIYGNGQTRP